MEVVSALCFGQTKPPEPELIQYLLEIAIVGDESPAARHPTSSEMTEADKESVEHTFLLQLLLEHKYRLPY